MNSKLTAPLLITGAHVLATLLVVVTALLAAPAFSGGGF